MLHKKKGPLSGQTEKGSFIDSHQYFNSKYDEIQEIKNKCLGHWRKIICFLDIELQEAIYSNGKHVPCPVHGGKDGLRTFEDFNETGGVVCNTCGAMHDGISTLKWKKGWSFPETIQVIEHCLKHIDKLPELDPGCIQSPKHDVDENERRIKVQQILDELIPIDDSDAKPAIDYFRNRGLPAKEIPEDLFFHPNLYYQGPGNDHYPAIVALITDEYNNILGLHRTYITTLGKKAPVSTPKMMLSIGHGSTKGGGIKLFPATDTLAIAEGIETALAVHELSKIPVWASVTAVGMGNLYVPDPVTTVFICYDKDRSETGLNAAKKLAKKLISTGKCVHLLEPPLPIPKGLKSIDWLDVLNAQGGPDAS